MPTSNSANNSSAADPKSGRATVKRNPRRAVYDDATLKAVLMEQQICHVAYVEDGQPRQIATMYIIDGEYLYMHGNRQAAYLKHMAAGGEVCVSAIIVDGLVIARSGFNCSMNYRSVTIFGKGEIVDGIEHLRLLDAFVDNLVPGHRQAVREPTSQEIAATLVVRVPLTEMSAKIRAGDPGDDAHDVASDAWAGQIPLAQQTLTPVAAQNLNAGIEMPDYIKNFKYRG